MRCQIPDDGGEEADDADGHEEAGPAVPVLCWRDAGEQNLPEDSEEMHDVVITGWKALLTTFLLVIIAITWRSQTHSDIFYRLRTAWRSYYSEYSGGLDPVRDLGLRCHEEGLFDSVGDVWDSCPASFMAWQDNNPINVLLQS